jgi:ferredoxin-NADP reductase
MPQPKKYKAEVVSITNPVENIYTIEFRSMTGKFRYLPGQFMHLALDVYDPSFGWPESRCFSMQSPPGNDFLKITFSVKGNFTGKMASELESGRIVDLKLPYGGLFQNLHSRTNVIFIAGGTGITPYLSAFTDPSFSIYSSPVLFFGVRSSEYNIYGEELAQAIRINPTLRINIICQDTDGILNIDDIFKENRTDKYYFISGPQVMISSFKTRLVALGIKELQILTDEWE